MTGWQRLCAAMDSGPAGRAWSWVDEKVDTRRRPIEDRRTVERFATVRTALANATTGPRCTP